MNARGGGIRREKLAVHRSTRSVRKTQGLEAVIRDDVFDLVKNNARMRLKRDSGRVCSWVWNCSVCRGGLRVTISNWAAGQGGNEGRKGMNVRDIRSKRARLRRCNTPFALMERVRIICRHCGPFGRTKRSSGFGSLRLSLSRSNSSPSS